MKPTYDEKKDRFFFTKEWYWHSLFYRKLPSSNRSWWLEELLMCSRKKFDWKRWRFADAFILKFKKQVPIRCAFFPFVHLAFRSNRRCGFGIWKVYYVVSIKQPSFTMEHLKSRTPEKSWRTRLRIYHSWFMLLIALLDILQVAK